MNLYELAKKYKNNRFAIFFFKPIWKVYKDKKQNLVYRKNAGKTLTFLKKCLDENNLFFWLDFGTLLGAQRDKDFIKHDCDIDIAMHAEDSIKVKEVLLKNGFNLLRTFEVDDDPLGTEHTYIFNDVQIDIFFYTKKNDAISYCHTFLWLPNESLQTTGKVSIKRVYIPHNGLFEKINFLGNEYNIPQNVTECLIANYGQNFMIPNKKFNYKNVAQNITYYSKLDKIATYTRFENK